MAPFNGRPFHASQRSSFLYSSQRRLTPHFKEKSQIRVASREISYDTNILLSHPPCHCMIRICMALKHRPTYCAAGNENKNNSLFVHIYYYHDYLSSEVFFIVFLTRTSRIFLFLISCPLKISSFFVAGESFCTSLFRHMCVSFNNQYKLLSL